MYHSEGHTITLKQDGVIEVRGKKVNLVAEDSCDIVSKLINVTGPAVFSEDIQVKGKSFLDHIHKDGDGANTTKPL